MQTASITVTIENQQPVELIDFTRSLLALGDQFKRDIENKGDGFEGKLYVKELRKGSLVAELMVIAATAGAVMEAANLTHGFATNLAATIDWLRAKASKPEKIDSKQVANISALLEPVAKDNGSNLIISINGDNNSPVIQINTTDANAAQNRAQRYIDSLKTPECAVHTKVLMYWDQVRNQDGQPASGEKARIDKLCDRPVKVVFDSRELREEMLYSSVNPLQEAYVVDVEVQTVRERIASYKVLQLHERIRLEDDKQSSPEPFL